MSHPRRAPATPAHLGPRFDYVAVGHVTVDIMADGSRRPGGSAFYSGLQASRLGLRTLILTRGVPAEIEGMLEPYRDELALEIQPATQTSTLHTSGTGDARRQRVLAWAGAIEEPRIEGSILHLAPVARETPRRWRGSVDFVGLTPQGLVREWSQADGTVSLAPAASGLLPAGCDAMVMSELERSSCAELISKAKDTGAVVAITAGHRPTTVLGPGADSFQVRAPATAESGEDLGAGDVFAAAFFIALHERCDAREAAALAGAAAALRIAVAGTEGIAERAAIEARAEVAEPPL